MCVLFNGLNYASILWSTCCIESNKTTILPNQDPIYINQATCGSVRPSETNASRKYFGHSLSINENSIRRHSWFEISVVQFVELILSGHASCYQCIFFLQNFYVFSAGNFMNLVPRCLWLQRLSLVEISGIKNYRINHFLRNIHLSY